MNDDNLKRMHKASNSFARERTNEFTKKLADTLAQDNIDIEQCLDQVRELVGQILAIGYAKGYDDCFNQRKVMSLLL